MNATTEKSQAAGGTAGSYARSATPKKGEAFRCQKCGMELQVTADCKCSDPSHVHLQCCGQVMHKA